MTPQRTPRDMSKVQGTTWREFGPPTMVGGIEIRHSGYEVELHDDDLPYRLRVVVEFVDGEVRCAGFHLDQLDGGPPVTSTALRSIPLAAYAERAFSIGPDFPVFPQEPDEEGFNARLATPDDVRAAVATNGRHQRTPKADALRQVVEEYRRALADPDPAVRRAPTQAVADRLRYGRGHVSRLLAEARRTDPPMLGPARRGRSGERPT